MTEDFHEQLHWVHGEPAKSGSYYPILVTIKAIFVPIISGHDDKALKMQSQLRNGGTQSLKECETLSLFATHCGPRTYS